jgi:HNH endonuclease
VVMGTIAITDAAWYRFLAAYPQLEEVNFWRPSAHHGFRAERFSPFLFKLRAPDNAICGYAYFAQYSRLPMWLAWEAFGIGNGHASLDEMTAQIGRLRRGIRYELGPEAEQIGCIQLVSPVFFSRSEWIPQPEDWHPRIQTPKRYDLSSGEGKRIWDACLARTRREEKTEVLFDLDSRGGDHARLGEPRLVAPRLGQGTFRIAVMDAYGRACAATGEHSLPALEAAHIRPFAADGPNEVHNGVLLRADLHRLFDKGYVTVTPDLKLEVSSRLKRDFKNGRTYYPMAGTSIQVPARASDRPAADFVRWHNESVFLH